MTSIEVAKHRARFFALALPSFLDCVLSFLLPISCPRFQVMAKRTRSPLSLRVEGWNSESEAESDNRSRPGKKRLKLSLSKKGKCRAQDKENCERFEFISGAEVKTLGKRFVPKNTESSTKWALTNYVSWRDKRNATYSDNPSEQVPQDLLASKDPAEISK